MKIVDYYIVSRFELFDLHQEVTDMMTEGWQPLGGAVPSGERIIQTMVKYSEITISIGPTSK